MSLRKIMLRFSLLFFLLFHQVSGSGQQTVGLFLNDSLSLNGYTLFATTTITYLIDNCGFVAHTWSHSRKPGLSVYLLENGDLLRPGVGGGGLVGSGVGGIIERFSWEGDLLWSYQYASSTARQHHDIRPLPNGNVLILAWESKTKEEAIAAGRNPDFTGDKVISEHLVEVKPTGPTEGEIVWEWHVWDHLIQDHDPEKDNFGVVADHPELINVNFMVNIDPSANQDWIHANGIDYNPERDEIAISSRHFNEIWIVDHSTSPEEAVGHQGGQSNEGGDLLYRWGNPQTYQRGTLEDKKFFGQHHVQWIPKGYPNEGKIIVFNNGQYRPVDPYSSVDIIEPPINSDGNYEISDTEAYGPQDLFWTHREEELNSTAMSGVQALINGNVLICYALGMHFVEVNTEGKVVWDYISGAGINGPLYQGIDNFGATFRATRYAADYPAFQDRDLSPGDPIELEPLPSNCTIYGEISAIKNPVIRGIHIVQNPIFETLEINNDQEKKLSIQILNVNGQVLLEKKSRASNIQINSNQLVPGIYFVFFSEKGGNRGTLIKKIVKY